MHEHGAAREQLLERAALVGRARIVVILERADRIDLEVRLADELEELVLGHQAGVDRIAQDAFGAIAGGGGDALDGALAARGMAQHRAVGRERRMRAGAPAREGALDVDERGRHAVLDERGHHGLQPG